MKDPGTLTTKTTQPRNVQTAQGRFQTRITALIPLKTRNRTIKAEALVHKGLSANLLSVAPIVDGLGAIMFDDEGAALLEDKEYKRL